MADPFEILEGALTAVGELLARSDTHVAVVVVGGATLNLLGFVPPCYA